MNETDRLILRGIRCLVRDKETLDMDSSKIIDDINEALAPKEDDGLSEQRDKDLEEGSLKHKKTEDKK